MSERKVGRERIDELLSEVSLRGTMESTWEYHGVRYVAALVLATLEVADALTDIAVTIQRATDQEETP
jgi:hypothetical protein